MVRNFFKKWFGKQQSNTTSDDMRFTGSIPENYDRYLGPLLFEFSAQDLAQQIASSFDGVVNLLEVACGTGILTRHLSRVLPKGSKIIATDLSGEMIEYAQKVNGKLAGVTYEQADALDLPFKDKSFDVVVCQFGLMFFPDKLRGLSEMARALKPGGLLGLNVWDSLSENRAVEIVVNVIDSCFDSDPPQFLHIPFGYYDLDEGQRLLAEAGFADITVEKVRGRVETTDHSSTARGLITGNPTILEVEKRAQVDVEELIALAAEALEQEFGEAPVTLEFQEIIYLASKP